MPNEPTTRLVAGTIINKENFNEVARAVLSGATLMVTAAAPTGYTRHFQHQDWIDFVDPVQAGGSNGFNERFHALESEFDLVATAISSVDNAVTDLQSASPAIGLTVAVGLSNGATIPVPSGFQLSETQFFAFVKFYSADPTTGQNLNFRVFADTSGKVTATAGTGQSVLATGIAISKKGGW